MTLTIAKNALFSPATTDLVGYCRSVFVSVFRFLPDITRRFYQVAEIGLRIEIANDSPWYAPRLRQAIEGQDKARALMDEMGVDLAKKSRMYLA